MNIFKVLLFLACYTGLTHGMESVPQGKDLLQVFPKDIWNMIAMNSSTGSVFPHVLARCLVLEDAVYRKIVDKFFDTVEFPLPEEIETFLAKYFSCVKHTQIGEKFKTAFLAGRAAHSIVHDGITIDFLCGGFVHLSPLIPRSADDVQRQLDSIGINNDPMKLKAHMHKIQSLIIFLKYASKLIHGYKRPLSYKVLDRMDDGSKFFMRFTPNQIIGCIYGIIFVANVASMVCNKHITMLKKIMFSITFPFSIPLAIADTPNSLKFPLSRLRIALATGLVVSTLGIVPSINKLTTKLTPVACVKQLEERITYGLPGLERIKEAAKEKIAVVEQGKS